MLKKKGERETKEAAFHGNISLLLISPLPPGNADVHGDGDAIFVRFLTANIFPWAEHQSRSNTGTIPASGLLFQSDLVESFIPRSEAVRFQTQSTEHTRELTLTEITAASARQPGPEGEVGLNTWGKGEETIRQVEDGNDGNQVR